jgi:hypothetical protein
LTASSSRDAIVAWRIWRVRGGGLCAVVWGTPWLPRKRFEARCDGRPSPYWQPYGDRAAHHAPESACECGIYAFKARVDAELLAREKVDHDVIAVGRVSLWGHVLETEHGYRAEFAYPYDLVLLGGTDELARRIRSAYAVDVECADAAVQLHGGGG